MSNSRQAKITEAMRLLNASSKYRGRYMHSGFRALGASMKERSGTVESWVEGKTEAGLDDLISALGGNPAAIRGRALDDFADF